MTVDNSGKLYTFSGAGKITGGTSLVKQGTGRLILGNTGANDYTGATTISAGTLQLGAANALPNGTGKQVPTVNGTLDLAGFSPTLNALNGAGAVTSSVAGAATLTLGAGDASGTFSGVMSDGAGTLALEKIGGGRQTLKGANTYSGGTKITAGALEIGDGGSVNGSITIAGGGAKLTLNRSDTYAMTNAINALGTNGVGDFSLIENIGTGTLSFPDGQTHTAYINHVGGTLKVTSNTQLGAGTSAIYGTYIGNGTLTNLRIEGGITIDEPLTLAQKAL